MLTETAVTKFSVCTTCLHLTSRGADTQRCTCEKQVKPKLGILDCPSGFHLCYICARKIAGGISRWSWNACNFCLLVNRQLQQDFGGSLPLGRHSIMNGFSVPFNTVPVETEAAIKNLVASLSVQDSMNNWGKLRARELLKSVPDWAPRKNVELTDWHQKFKASRFRSTAAFKKYFGVDELAELKERL